MKARAYRKKVIAIIIIIIMLIILISLHLFIPKNNFNFQEDLIFFKLIGSRKENQEKVNKEYEFRVIQGVTNYNTIDLNYTADYKTLVNEKVAPGTKGNFNIKLTSNEMINYEIFIRDKSQAPRNFKIYIQQEKGTIKKYETKVIQCNWEWLYEENEGKDAEDTKDGETIKNYNFEIGVIGELY